MGKNKTASSLSQTAKRPPIVVVVGHVDHGKTTLLDFIRKSNVASREQGGITQSIGAYQISIPSLSGTDSSGYAITFIDTPGHEAFSKMRSRGANVADLAILVVASDDSVKPQTIEAIRHIKEAGVPMIVAANKTDVPGSNLERVKKDLAKNGVQAEGYGGDIPFVPISAKTGAGVKELLEMIQVMSSMDTRTDKSSDVPKAVVIETKKDKARGIVVSVIVTGGAFHANDELYEGDKKIGKIRAAFDDRGAGVKQADAGKPVEIIGFSEFPLIGSEISTIQGQGKKAEAVRIPVHDSSNDMPDFLKPLDEQKNTLNVVLKADTAGSLEAVALSISDKIEIVRQGIGVVTEDDIAFAKSTKSFVIGFRVIIDPNASKLALTEKVVYRSYQIIYDLLDDLAEVADNIEDLIKVEREVGSAFVVAEFPFDNQKVAGVKVSSGRLSRGDTVKIMRGNEEVIRAKIKSMRQGKNETNKTEANKECGILFDKNVDFRINDAIIAIT